MVFEFIVAFLEDKVRDFVEAQCRADYNLGWVRYIL